MILCQLHDATDARDIDDTRCISRRPAASVCSATREEAEEGGRDEEDREGVDGIEATPRFGRFVVE